MKILKKLIWKTYILIRVTYYKFYKKNIVFGKNVYFRRRFIVENTDGGSIEIGNEVFINNGCSIYCKKRVEIGNHTLIGENVKIYDHNHCFSNYNMPIASQGFKLKPVFIGNNCWIGSNVVILPGAIVHDNTVIGAGCIIDSEIPEGSIVTSDRNLIIKKRRRT